MNVLILKKLLYVALAVLAAIILGGIIALAVGEGAEGQGTKLRIYDSSFANVACAMRADSLAAVMRVGFNGCDHQFSDANGSYAEIGRA